MPPETDAGTPAAETTPLTQAHDTSLLEGAPAAETPAETTEQPGGDPAAEPVAATPPAEEAPEAKQRRSAQERIDKAVKAQRDAERDAAYWRGKAEGKPGGETPPAQPKEDTEPDPTDYQYGETDPGYIKALGTFTARQEFHRLSQEQERKTQARTVEQSWEQRQQAFAKDKPDYFEVLDREWPCTPPMADAIRTSDEGASVAYHLAQNPDEARRIAALNPLAQVREIGRLEARLATPAQPDTATPPLKTASDAPAPPPQVRGQGGKFKPPPDTDDFAAFEKAYPVTG